MNNNNLQLAKRTVEVLLNDVAEILQKLREIKNSLAIERMNQMIDDLKSTYDVSTLVVSEVIDSGAVLPQDIVNAFASSVAEKEMETAKGFGKSLTLTSTEMTKLGRDLKIDLTFLVEKK